ncbi:hypothetical protein QAD02_002286 [Eretmocerus hayati]|uniref:Uncharacterized protein n=1 Tax=Eretmocerus hayati TaxID=131215 RepID=A0ACC2NIU9_9HYME|nr:hypothetical protein QAD02_002286 [Eretmocerus hayati]
MLGSTADHADKCYVAKIPLNTIDIYVEDDEDKDDTSYHIPQSPEKASKGIHPSRDVDVKREEELGEIQADVNFLASIDDLQLVNYSDKELAIDRQGYHRLSSDRLQRVTENVMIGLYSVPETFSPPNSHSHKCDGIRKGEWCVFRREEYKKTKATTKNKGNAKKKNTIDDNDTTKKKSGSKKRRIEAPEGAPKQCLVGHVRYFAYLDSGTTSETQYSNMFAIIEGNEKIIGVMCFWFVINPDGSLEQVETHTHGFHNIDNYVKTIFPPIEHEHQQYVPRLIVEEFGSMCGPIQITDIS